MMLSAASCFPGQMPFHQQAVDIVIGVPSAALVNCPCAFSKGQCRNAVILRDNDIPALTKIVVSDHLSSLMSAAFN